MQKRQTLLKGFALLKNDITGSESTFKMTDTWFQTDAERPWQGFWSGCGWKFYFVLKNLVLPRMAGYSMGLACPGLRGSEFFGSA